MAELMTWLGYSLSERDGFANTASEGIVWGNAMLQASNLTSPYLYGRGTKSAATKDEWASRIWSDTAAEGLVKATT